jgi:hypothetical protein
MAMTRKTWLWDLVDGVYSAEDGIFQGHVRRAGSESDHLGFVAILMVQGYVIYRAEHESIFAAQWAVDDARERAARLRGSSWQSARAKEIADEEIAAAARKHQQLIDQVKKDREAWEQKKDPFGPGVVGKGGE